MRLAITLTYLALSSSLVAAGTSLTAAVEAGLDHFRAECTKQQAVMAELLAALKKRDLSRSRAAYVAARPPYEQIETLANVFPDIDAAIDARPYAFSFGEDNPEFTGFHRLERDIYRDQDLSKAYVTGLALNKSVNSLCKVLGKSRNFDPVTSWDGIMALVYEVPAKKISSEEETWSDLSLMIFRNNFRGLWSQASPFFETKGAKKKAVREAKERYQQIQNVLQQIDPDNSFFTERGDARAYSTVTVAERKTIIDSSYQLAEALGVIRNQVAPNGGDEEEKEEEEGSGDGLNAKYAAETAEGVRYFLTKCREQQTLLQSLIIAVSGGNLAAARSAYKVARLPYEQIETIAPSFPDLDAAIDQRPYALGLGELDPEWRGFHQVERQLYRDGDLKGAATSLKVLRDSVDGLCDTLKDDKKAFTAERTWEGLLALAFEVPAKKISSEEETWSDLSLMIFRENVIGIQSQYMPFRDRLPAKIAGDVDMAFKDIRDYILSVADRGNTWKGTHFRKYSDVTISERKGISDLFYDYGRALRAARAAL